MLARLSMPTGPDTLLRLVRRAPLPAAKTPRVVGVDDWALRKGRTYGSILIDLEAHCVVDLLPDRAAPTLAAWLRRPPRVKVLTRDRSTEYARAAAAGAPKARQVADRWHLLLNARQMVESWLTGVHARLRALPCAPGTQAPPGAVPGVSLALEARWPPVGTAVRAAWPPTPRCNAATEQANLC